MLYVQQQQQQLKQCIFLMFLPKSGNGSNYLEDRPRFMIDEGAKVPALVPRLLVGWRRTESNRVGDGGTVWRL